MPSQARGVLLDHALIKLTYLYVLPTHSAQFYPQYPEVIFSKRRLRPQARHCVARVRNQEWIAALSLPFLMAVYRKNPVAEMGLRDLSARALGELREKYLTVVRIHGYSRISSLQSRK